MTVRICLIICLTLLLNPPLAAAPTGGQLLKACELAGRNGHKGIEASMCEWYVTPCDCNSADRKQVPRVCLPEGVPGSVLARRVIDGLRADPELRKKSAAYAAAVILSRDYPCTDSPSRLPDLE